VRSKRSRQRYKRYEGRVAIAAARPLYDRALAICEKTLGPEHPDTALSLDNLARLLCAQGDLVVAKPLAERALAIREKVFGSEHQYTASSLNTLAHFTCAAFASTNSNSPSSRMCHTVFQ
jgi:hypothetical protein